MKQVRLVVPRSTTSYLIRAFACSAVVASALVSALIVSASHARAETAYLEARAGAVVPAATLDNVNTGPAVGVGLGFRVLPGLSLDASYLGSRHTLSFGGFTFEDTSVIFHQLMGGLTFYVPLTGLRLSAAAGLAVTSASAGGFSDSEADFALNARAGYDFPIAPTLTLGPEVGYTYIAATGDDAGLLNLMLSLRFAL